MIRQQYHFNCDAGDHTCRNFMVQAVHCEEAVQFALKRGWAIGYDGKTYCPKHHGSVV